jgi:sterol-4alpha-carboxylate 3-dehydrogenase (decarboxylating)
MKVNYTATKELVEQAKQYPTVQAFVYTSSVEATVLRSARSGKPETEEGCTVNSLSSSGAINPYGRTKGAADSLVLAANTGRSAPSPSHSGKLLTTSLRVGGLYGERDLKTIWEMLKVINTNATRFQIGPDKVLHDWVYTANVTLAHILAAEALLSPSHPSHTNPSLKVDGEAFFITDDSPMKFWEFSRRVWKLGGDRYLNGSPNPRIIQIPFWALMGPVSAGEGIRKMAGGKGELKLSRHHLEFMKSGSRVSCDKAKARLGYRPVCGTEEGVSRSVAWFMEKENEVWFKGM